IHVHNTLVLARRVALLTLAGVGLAFAASSAGRLSVDLITLPPGFALEVFADDVPGARSMTLSPARTLFVGTRDKGVGYAIPGGWLYVPVGAPCNVCMPPGPLHETITRMKPDGSAIEVFARGVRNSVGFDWRPGSHDLWFTDNGRDWMGDDRPPDELNHAPKPGLHFGFPHCHGRALADPQFGRDKSCADFTPPAAELGPHVAALGMRFYTGAMFPP